MPFRKYKGVGDLVTFVVNTARDQGMNITPQTEARITYHCGRIHPNVRQNEQDVAVIAAALIAGGSAMAESERHTFVTPDDVDQGYWRVLRAGMDPPDFDLDCYNIFKCTETTILARQRELKGKLDHFRTLLDAIGEL